MDFYVEEVYPRPTDDHRWLQGPLLFMGAWLPRAEPELRVRRVPIPDTTLPFPFSQLPPWFTTAAQGILDAVRTRTRAPFSAPEPSIPLFSQSIPFLMAAQGGLDAVRPRGRASAAMTLDAYGAVPQSVSGGTFKEWRRRRAWQRRWTA